MSYSSQPLLPPSGATSQRMITDDRVGQADKATGEGHGGIYTEHCPSMAQIGIMGPKPGGAAFNVPCISQCEMPSGQRASTQERPGQNWDPALQSLSGGSMYFKRTGMISHRHPFHGFGADPTGEAAKMYSKSSPRTDAIDVYDLYVGQFDKRYVGVQGFGASTLGATLATPAVRGLLFGLSTYGVARAVGIEKGKAQSLGIVIGGMDIALSLAAGWLKKQTAGS